jgi:hypothetical protein
VKERDRNETKIKQERKGMRERKKGVTGRRAKEWR